MTSIKIHRYCSRPEAFFVNSWIIEFEDGLVIVDAQFLISEAEALVERLEQLGKASVALLITHPHPDHYNGGAVIKAAFPEIEIISTQKTFEGIKASEGPKRAFWTPIHHDDYPPNTEFPSRIAESGQPIKILGVDFLFQEHGAGECESVSSILLPEQKVLFSSDLIYHKVHPWLAEGRSSAWLQQIIGALETYHDIQQVYPGHGAATNLAGFHSTLNYINRLHELLRTNGDLTAVAAVLKHEFSEYPLEALVDLNIPAVAKELNLR